MEVEVLSKKLIKAPTSPAHQPQQIQLSFIDQLAPSAHIGCIFYYPIDHDACGDPTAESLRMRERLERSLSETLASYYPLAGRYMEDDLVVECNNEGVACWEARVGNSIELADIVHGNPDTKLLSCFMPWEATIGIIGTDKVPLVAIQVNVFCCGGLAIGVHVFHKIVDAFTLHSFMNAWGKASRGTIGQVTPPSFEFGSLLPARFSPQVKSAAPRGMLAEIITRRFVFDEAAINSMKSKAHGSKSQLALVSALIWKALIGASQAKHGRLRPSKLIHAVNLRGKTGLPMTENACGNFFTLAIAEFQVDESKMELDDLAGLVRDSIRNAIAEAESAAKTLVQKHGDEVFRNVITKSFADASEAWGNEEVDVYTFSSWCGFAFYEIDFGWGGPAWMSSYSIPMEFIGIVDTKCGSGLEAFVSLTEQGMLHFQQDKDIMAFTKRERSIS